MSVIIWIIVAIFLLVVAFFALAAVLQYVDSKKTAQHVLDYFVKNRDSSSICLLHNNEPLLEYHADRVMPLASTVKLILVIEYANQAAQGLVDPEARVHLNDVERYYIPGSDGGGHSSWKYDLKEKLEAGHELTLDEVARGMLQFSSNACTEYIFELLGGDRINASLGELGMEHHTSIFPLSSAMLTSMYVKDKEGLSGKNLIRRMREMSQEEYISLAYEMHNSLKQESDAATIQKLNRKEGYKRSLQKLESERLPGGTTKEYASLMNKINSGTYFSPDAQVILDRLVGRPPSETSQYRKIGFKGGTTIYVVTAAMYGCKKNGETLELAAFVNDSKGTENAWLKNKIDEFLVAIMKDDDFRNKVIKKLSSYVHETL
ncbi:class A beta-lactamase-related serine hydrolase [Paenibacillus sp. MZ04-78.2]|uniref:serine hydrolase n=1 Tax=Paenibacillus sp. MZ04-78.2 TaxID=2962034 RepID=UPI0020B75AF1|nr:serine hydrolase [Paenibacillus sp. MZ04-78.2]MCP3774919.1 class A beta-lactamase-related serine hydrolase [Paenibacillus sp. MZ04-78.2]